MILFIAQNKGLAFQDELHQDESHLDGSHQENEVEDITSQETADSNLLDQNSPHYTPNALLYALHFETDPDRIRAIVTALVKGQEIDLNTIRDFNSLTPLMVAVCGRQGEFTPAGVMGGVKVISKYLFVFGLGYLSSRYKEELIDLGEYLGIVPKNIALESVGILLEYGADPYEQNKKGQTALDYALEKNCDPDATKLIADSMGIDVW